MKDHNDYLCEDHKIYGNTTIYFPLSPCRSTCSNCKKKIVSGYTNPNHGSNPFGYCYLCPTLCVTCSIAQKKCMWCN